MITNIPKIKICCIMCYSETQTAMSYGANALGFVSEMPSGPGVLSEEEIKNIIVRLDPFVMSVLLTSKKTANEVFAQYEYCKPGALQLCEPMTEQELKYLSKALPGTPLIRVIHVSGPESIEEAKTFESLVSAFLLDTGQRTGPSKQLGGTGKTHDWSVSAAIVKRVEKPVILAGGLNPENVKDAIESVKPYAVDVCSGVRSNNCLDNGKLSAFFTNLS